MSLSVIVTTLPVYYCGLYPVEFIFNTVLERMKSKKHRYKDLSHEDFSENINLALSRFLLEDVKFMLTKY